MHSKRQGGEDHFPAVKIRQSNHSNHQSFKELETIPLSLLFFPLFVFWKKREDGEREGGGGVVVLYLATIYEQQHEHQKPTQIGLRRQFIISVYMYSTIWDGPVVQIKESLSIFFPYRQILQVEGGGLRER